MSDTVYDQPSKHEQWLQFPTGQSIRSEVFEQLSGIQQCRTSPLAIFRPHQTLRGTTAEQSAPVDDTEVYSCNQPQIDYSNHWTNAQANFPSDTLFWDSLSPKQRQQLKASDMLMPFRIRWYGTRWFTWIFVGLSVCSHSFVGRSSLAILCEHNVSHLWKNCNG